MSGTKIVRVSHLFGIDVSYQMHAPYDPTKPVCVLINSFATTSDLYQAQFRSRTVHSCMNLIAIEPLGHGQTRTKTPVYTYWDTAIMILQALDELQIPGRVFALGTSQGGWIAVRMALLAPHRIAGIMPLGTSMDYESERSRKMGCFDAPQILTPIIEQLQSATPTPDFVIPDSICDLTLFTGFGGQGSLSSEEESFWRRTMRQNYSGDEGRLRLKEITINLRDRDGLHARLPEVKCPVRWMHGTRDAVYSVAVAEEEIDLFVNSSENRLVVVDGGQHFLSATHPEVVSQVMMDFVAKHTRFGSEFFEMPSQ